MSKVDFLELETDSPSFRSISIYIVDDTGIKPVTPSMSRKCSTAEPIVRVGADINLPQIKPFEVETGFEPV